MASPLQFKVHREGELVAAHRYAEDAAADVGLSGGNISYGNRIVWREGSEAMSASQSYDHAAITMRTRIRHHHEEALAKQGYRLNADGNLERIVP